MLCSAGLVLLAVLALAPAAAQTGEPRSEAMPAGMRVYQVGLLESGPRSGEAQGEEAARLLDAHHAHLQEAFEAGVLVASGPVVGAGRVRGIVMFAAGSLDEALARAASDPAVRAGALAVRMFVWWGPEGIGDAYRRRFEADPGAEDEMVEYQLGLLVRDGGAEAVPERARRIQTQHLAYLARMSESGALVAAGPFEGDGDLRGLAIYRVDSLEAARRMAEADPAVLAGRLRIEMLPWLASAW